MLFRFQVGSIVFIAMSITAGALWFSRAAADPTISDALNEVALEARAKNPQPQRTLPPGPHPKAVVDRNRYDFGRMSVGEERSHPYMIRNEGDAPLRLTPGETTCKCTLLDLNAGELAPGESVEVELSWKPSEAAPVFRQSAAIETNDPLRPEIRLIAEGVVDPTFTLLPEGVWQIGEILDEEPTVVSGTVFSSSIEHFQVMNVTASHPSLTAMVTPLDQTILESLGAKSGYTIQVTISPGLPIGFLQQTLKLRTDLPGGEELTVVLEGERAGLIRFLGQRYSIEERMFHLGNFSAEQGRRAVLSVFVKSPRNGEEVRLDVVNVEPSALKVTPRLDPSFESTHQKRFELVLEYPAGAPPISLSRGNAPGRIEFRTNVPRAESFSVPIDFVAY